MQCQIRETKEAYSRIGDLAAYYVQDVDLRPTSDFKSNGSNALYDAMGKACPVAYGFLLLTNLRLRCRI